jgi:hypothetical protein
MLRRVRAVFVVAACCLVFAATAASAIVRVSGNLSAGAHVVQVQYSVSATPVAFNLDDWALVVQRIKVS